MHRTLWLQRAAQAGGEAFRNVRATLALPRGVCSSMRLAGSSLRR